MKKSVGESLLFPASYINVKIDYFIIRNMGD
jgi:hypothetical protein